MRENLLQIGNRKEAHSSKFILKLDEKWLFNLKYTINKINKLNDIIKSVKIN